MKKKVIVVEYFENGPELVEKYIEEETPRYTDRRQQVKLVKTTDTLGNMGFVPSDNDEDRYPGGWDYE